MTAVQAKHGTALSVVGCIGVSAMMHGYRSCLFHRMAPVYDNNRSLLFQFDTETLEKNPEWCISKCEPRIGGDFIKTAQAMLTDELCSELKSMAGFRFREPIDIEVPTDRLEALSKILNLQLNKILQ